MTLHHTALEAAPDDRQPLVDFFGLMGFEEVEVPEGLRGITRWVERDGTQIHFLFIDTPTAAPFGHVAVVASDYDETQERLRAAGFEVDEHPEYWGSPRSFVRGPGGHLVELMKFPPGAAA